MIISLLCLMSLVFINNSEKSHWWFFGDVLLSKWSVLLGTFISGFLLGVVFVISAQKKTAQTNFEIDPDDDFDATNDILEEPKKRNISQEDWDYIH